MNNEEQQQQNQPEELDARLSETFVPPEGAVIARFRRLNLETGGWEDAQVMCDKVRTSTVDVNKASPDLPLIEATDTWHRISWYNANNRVVGHSKKWRPGQTLATMGGASNTPRMWPAPPPVGGGAVSHGVPHVGNASPPAPGYLTSKDALVFMRGLGTLVHEMTGPLVAQVQMISEQTLARERAFHEARLAAEIQRHAEALERDRQFAERMREVHEAPRDARIAELEAELESVRKEQTDLAEAAAEQEQETQDAQTNSMDVASTLIENAPAIIKTVKSEFFSEEPSLQPPDGSENDSESQ